MLLDDNAYLLLIPLILAAIYPGWKVEERNKVKTTENMKNENIYSPVDLISYAHFGSYFNVKLTFMTVENLPRSTTYIIYNPTAI